MFLYRILISIAYLLLPFISLFSPRIKRLYQGHMGNKIPILHRGQNIWFHCSSYGEYEGIAPLLAQYHDQSECTTILSFFSPSGYEATFQLPIADCICYAPLDREKQVNSFIHSIQPSVLIVSQNEYWPHMISVCQEQNIPVFFIGTYVREKHWWLSSMFRSITEPLRQHADIILQDEASFQLLQEAGYANLNVMGNPRYIQASRTRDHPRQYPLIESVLLSRPCIVWGSTLDSDHQLIAAALAHLSAYTMILVPHEIDEEKLRLVETYLPTAIRYSKLSENHTESKIIIMDTMGDLKYLYQYADIAYVGGGFEKGTHSVIEPAAFIIPVLSGPNIEKFIDARKLHSIGVLRLVHSADELVSQIEAGIPGLSENIEDELRTHFDENTMDIQEIIDKIDQTLDSQGPLAGLS